MLQQIDTRELFALEGAFPTIRGTYHKPHESSNAQIRIGVLFLNGLFATRSANGDAAVYWADSLAEQGFPTFRIDLPGFGDAEGDPPKDWLGYINSGKYAAVTAAGMKELTKRFGLKGVVIVGHCAGAVTTVYAAGVSQECRGVVLMDPYFFLPRIEIPKVRQQLNAWARKSHVGGLLSRVFDQIKQMRLKLYRNRLPDNANLPLLRCWKQIASTELPILILKSPNHGASGAQPRVGEFDYSRHILELAGPKHRVTEMAVNGTTHSFSNDVGRAAVQQTLCRWLNTSFRSENTGKDFVPAKDSKSVGKSEGVKVTSIA